MKIENFDEERTFDNAADFAKYVKLRLRQKHLYAAKNKLLYRWHDCVEALNSGHTLINYMTEKNRAAWGYEVHKLKLVNGIITDLATGRQLTDFVLRDFMFQIEPNPEYVELGIPYLPDDYQFKDLRSGRKPSKIKKVKRGVKAQIAPQPDLLPKGVLND